MEASKTGSMAAKPAPVDLSHHYSKTTKNRQPSGIKNFYKYFQIPGIANLAGGMPNNNNFPFDTLEATAALPQRFTPTPNKPVDPPSEKLSKVQLSDGPSTSRVVVPKASDNEDILRKIDVRTALQYGTAQGYPPLYSFLRQFTIENLHPNIPYAEGPEIILTCGSTDGFAKTLEALTNPWDEDRDWIGYKEGLLVEDFCYMNAVQGAKPRGMNIVPVAVDDQGMCAEGPHGLLDVLENWDASRGKRPHMIYTVTIGQNPTSGTLGVCRRKAIYALCVKYDIIIVEDDPYWYLQYPSANSLSLAHRGHPTSTDARPGDPYHYPYNSPRNGSSFPYTHTPAHPRKSSGYPFLDSLVPSYLSIDYEGRVVRLDTFSKTVAPGCRLGWITTQPNLCERLLRITETSTQQPSGFVQSLIAELIMGPHDAKHGRGGGKNDNGWQMDGWVRWLEGLRGGYERRMNTMCNILEEGKTLVRSGRRRSLCRHPININNNADSPFEEEDWSIIDTTPLYTFTYPLGGMFIWVSLNFPTHPLWPHYSSDLETLSTAFWAHLTTPKYKVLISPGSIFAASEEIRTERSWQFFRVCFAAVGEGEVGGVSRRFVEGVRAFWGVEDIGEVEVLASGVGGGGEGLGEGMVDLRGLGC